MKTGRKQRNNSTLLKAQKCLQFVGNYTDNGKKVSLTSLCKCECR